MYILHHVISRVEQTWHRLHKKTPNVLIVVPNVTLAENNLVRGQCIVAKITQAILWCALCDETRAFISVPPGLYHMIITFNRYWEGKVSLSTTITAM